MSKQRFYLDGKRYPTHQKQCTIFAFQGLLTCWSARDGVPVLKLYYQRSKIHPAGGDGPSSIIVVLPERKSSRPPATAVTVLKLYYERTKILPAASDGRSK